MNGDRSGSQPAASVGPGRLGRELEAEPLIAMLRDADGKVISGDSLCC
jgi:hypothetical protein